jgi:hypothetical protein
MELGVHAGEKDARDNGQILQEPLLPKILQTALKLAAMAFSTSF